MGKELKETGREEDKEEVEMEESSKKGRIVEKMKCEKKRVEKDKRKKRG